MEQTINVKKFPHSFAIAANVLLSFLVPLLSFNIYLIGEGLLQPPIFYLISYDE